MIDFKEKRFVYAPFDWLTITTEAQGNLVVRDGANRVYFEGRTEGDMCFQVSGALGMHLVQFLGDDGVDLEELSFHVDCKTQLQENSGKFSRLFDMLHYTLHSWGEGGTSIRHQGKFYKFYVRWLRDHVHTLKGMKYFDGDIKTGIELYADTQQPNGMIWDRHEDYGPHTSWRDFTFSYGGFVKMYPGSTRRFERIPVENDVEYLFIEGLYYTWKATGDDEWMRQYLDHALKAVEYATTDPYRWSEKYQLLKRGFTIDTWDFQSSGDIIMEGGAMCVDKDQTCFGVMHGDNTGMMASCRYLAEMLRVAGREDEAAKMDTLASDLKRRLDDLAWNGEFYTHHVPERDNPNRDFGNTDLDRQVSLSNAYALNRGLDENQCEAIIKTYQRIRKEMPESSPGEFYQIFPIFDKGFGGHGSYWEYMNGGVTTIVAGELAHGAFEHGFENYGVDILERLVGWGEKHGGYFDCCLKGALPKAPERNFSSVNISAQTNVSFCGEKDGDAVGWLGELKNDIRNMPTGMVDFQDIPFAVPEIEATGMGGCIGLSGLDDRYAESCEIDIDSVFAQSVYLLQTCSDARVHDLVGVVELVYSDGTTAKLSQYAGFELGNWFMPSTPRKRDRKGSDIARVAWRGENPYFPNVGCYVTGLENPQPGKAIHKIRLLPHATDAKWMVMGLTFCDAPVYFPTSDVSFGIPDNWGAGAVVYALIEGLAGVVISGRDDDVALLCPRWLAADVEEADVVVKMEASGRYVAYRYSMDESHGIIQLDIAGSADCIDLSLPVPDGSKVKAVFLDNVEVEIKDFQSGTYTYIRTRLAGRSVKQLRIEYGY